MLKKRQKRYRAHQWIRAKIYGRADRPRLSVFRSNKHIYAQIINDEKGQTLVAASDLEFKKLKKGQKSKVHKTDDGKKIQTKKIAIAYEVGKLIAKKALRRKIKKIVFDRDGYKYHGRIQALAEGAREGGLEF